ISPEPAWAPAGNTLRSHTQAAARQIDCNRLRFIRAMCSRPWPGRTTLDRIYMFTQIASIRLNSHLNTAAGQAHDGRIPEPLARGTGSSAPTRVLALLSSVVPY